MNRLFVDEILSIGMVAAGDNPESEVLIYKAKTESEWSRQMNLRFEALDTKITDLHRRQSLLSDTPKTPKKRTPPMSEGNRIQKAYDRERRRSQGEDIGPADLDEMVKDKLDGFAKRQQFEGEIAGRYGYLSTPAAEMVQKIKAKWWDTPDGIAVRDLLRESGGEPADLTKITKAHSEARAAIARLDDA